MSLCVALIMALGVLVLLPISAPSRAGAIVQEPLGTGCGAQAENDARVRDLFSPLLRRLGPTVGTTVGCIADGPESSLTQVTTTGLMYARPESSGALRMVVFTDGFRHWAVDANLSRVTLYWEGDSSLPPATGVTRIPVPPEVAATDGPWPPAFVVPQPTPSSANRLATGENVSEPTYAGGRGSVTVVNDLPVDLAFKLRDADGARAARAFVYVRSGERTRLDSVKPGAYQIQAISGSDWDIDRQLFRRAQRVFKADEVFELIETHTEDGDSWIDQTLTLKLLGTGDNELVPISLEEFQQE